MKAESLRELIEHHRQVLHDLEQELETLEKSRGQTWQPEKFYTAYHVLSGMLIGMGAAWITLALNALGSHLLHGDPLKLMRVYGTFFAGEEALGTGQAAILMLSVGIHTLTGAICGAPIHVLVSRHWSGRPLVQRAALGIVLGLVMWVVNFYLLLSWLQPLVVGTGTIIEQTPPAIAAANHVAFAVLVMVLQPLGVFRRTVAPSGTSPASGSP